MLDGMLLVYHFEGLLVDLLRCQHVRHPFDQAGYVRPARPLVFLVLPQGDGGCLPAGAVHPPVPVVEPWTRGYGRGVDLPEDGDALLHLFRLDLDGHYPCEHRSAPPPYHHYVTLRTYRGFRGSARPPLGQGGVGELEPVGASGRSLLPYSNPNHLRHHERGSEDP